MTSSDSAIPALTAPAPSVPTEAAAPLRHPPGLKIIFLTEMWERFSYYGMRALLVLYLVNALGYPRAEALKLYGIYTGLVYVTPLLGGYLADRWLGARRGAVIGAAIMMLGHFAMAFPALLHLALGLLIVGNGFFKPNTTSMVGLLYPPEDARRAGGYTIFYMGVNLGAFLAPLAAGTLGERLGWHWGFASAGVGMAIGLVVLLRGQALLGRAGLREGQVAVGRRDLRLVLGMCAGAVALVWGGEAAWGLLAASLVRLPTAATLGLAMAIVVLAFGLPRLRRRQVHLAVPLTHAERGRVLAIAVVAFFVIFFWMGFEQAGGTMNLFADKQTDRHAFGIEIPTSWFQSVGPLAIVALAPLFAVFWTRLDRSRFALPDPAKQGLGLIVLGLGFVVMAVAQRRADALGSVGPQWLVVVYLLHTVGELMLSPVGLSLVSRVAPPRLLGVLMGVWLGATSVANYMAGILESLLAGSGLAPFDFLCVVSIAAGLLMLAVTPWLNRLMRRVD